MKTLFFLTFVIAMLGLGVAWLRTRSRQIAEESEARANARAEVMGLLPDGKHADAAVPPTEAALLAEAMRSAAAASKATPAARPAAATSPAAPQVASEPAEAATGTARDAAPETGPPNIRRLRKMSRARFARVGITYFEILGFRVRRFATHDALSAPIDALLFMGTAAVPTMALRWSRSEGERASLSEVRSFAEACAQLRIPRSSFIAQFGIDDEAAGYADSCGVVCLDAETLARRLAETDTVHHPRLHEVAYGAR